MIATFATPMPAVVHGVGEAHRPGFESVHVLAVFTQPDDGVTDAFTSFLVLGRDGKARWAARDAVEFKQMGEQ
jgi:hypothetical protein